MQKEVFSGLKLPPYCHGGGYFISMRVVKSLLTELNRNRELLDRFKMAEDVLFTG